MPIVFPYFINNIAIEDYDFRYRADMSQILAF